MKISFLHLDLGIGGAERLVVNVACALKSQGHDVTIFTSHHDPKHSFEETQKGGILGNCIHVYGDWLPQNVFGKCTALCAIIRMIYLSLVLLLINITSSKSSKTDLVFMDGISASIPILSIFNIPVMFYCHFPDKLLCTERKSLYKQIYRYFIDGVEEATTGCSNLIVVNSKFTALMFQKAFPSLGKLCNPSVLYPTIEMESVPSSSSSSSSSSSQPLNSNSNDNKGRPSYSSAFRHIFVSLNRYERKKCISLAIEALHQLKKKKLDSSSAFMSSPSLNKSKENNNILLIIAGGYDNRVLENKEYFDELCDLAHSLGLKYSFGESEGTENLLLNSTKSVINKQKKIDDDVDVVFRVSISNEERQQLLSCATALLYTPANEHFGIVPIEAMHAGCPVIAVANGGPLETVVDKETGYLCQQTPEEFADAMFKLMQLQPDTGNNIPSGRSSMSDRCRKHVEENFTVNSMKEKLELYISLAAKGGDVRDKARVWSYLFFWSGFGLLLICCFGGVISFFKF